MILKYLHTVSKTGKFCIDYVPLNHSEFVYLKFRNPRQFIRKLDLNCIKR